MIPYSSPAIQDVVEGLLSWRLWLRIAWMDTVRRYRRTTIGPFWTTASVAVFISTVGIMYSQVFHQEIHTYLPYLASGFIVWAPLTTYLTESCGSFFGAEGILKQMKMPYTIFVIAAIVRNVILFFHNFIVYIIVFLIFQPPLNANTLLAFPAMLLLLINAVWVGILMALICTRFRDLLQVVAALLQAAFFVTPIFWNASQAGGLRSMFVDFNFLYHFVVILRAPLLGEAPAMADWYAVFACTGVGWALALWMFHRYYNRIIFWI